MWNFWGVSAAAVLILFAWCDTNAQEQRIDLVAGNIGINLSLPAGLQPFSEERMALIRENGVAAKFVFSDPNADLILAINTFGNNANEKGFSRLVEEVKAAAAKRSSKVQWLANSLITINGKKWLRLSFKSGPEGNELIDEYFITDWIGEYVLLNFSFTPDNSERFAGEIQRSANSVRFALITDDVEAITGGAKAAPKRQ